MKPEHGAAIGKRETIPKQKTALSANIRTSGLEE